MIHGCNFYTIFRRYRILPTRGTVSRRTWYPRVDSKKIHVVLLKDSANLGRAGEIVETSRGFANYDLIPNGIACYANWYNIDLHCKHPEDSASSERDLHADAGEDLCSLMANPEFVLFSRKLASYSLVINRSTFVSDRTRLTSPLSLYSVLDELSSKCNIDLVPSQITRITDQTTGSELNLIQDSEYVTFCNIGKYEFEAILPLNSDRENKLEFTLEIAQQQHGRIHGESDTFEFYLPQS